MNFGFRSGIFGRMVMDTATDPAGGAGAGSAPAATTTNQAAANNAAQTTQGQQPGASAQTNNGGAPNQNSTESDPVDLNSLPANVQKLIRDLRTESAGHRTQNRTLTDRLNQFESGLKQALNLDPGAQVTPEQQIESLTAQGHDLQAQNAILMVGLENGLNMDQTSYLQFLLQQHGQTLEDDEEISDEVFDQLLLKARSVGGQMAAATQTGTVPGTTSVGTGQVPGNAPAQGSVPTVHDFAKMTYQEKVALRARDEALYNKLFAEAKGTRAF